MENQPNLSPESDSTETPESPAGQYPASPPMTEPPASSGMVKGIGIGLLIAIVLVAGYGALAYIQKLWPFGQNISQTDDQIVDDSPWKTYDSRTFDFSVSYPSSLSINEVDSGPQSRINFFEADTPGTSASFFIHLLADQQTFGGFYGDATIGATETTIGNGIPAFRITRSDEIVTYLRGTGEREDSFIVFVHQPGDTLAESVLSTFRFAEMEEQIDSSWKTYQDAPTGISLRLPPGWQFEHQGNVIFVDNGIENPSNIDIDPSWVQFQLRLPLASALPDWPNAQAKLFGTLNGLQTIEPSFFGGTSIMGVAIRISSDAVAMITIYGAHEANLDTLATIFSTLQLSEPGGI